VLLLLLQQLYTAHVFNQVHHLTEQINNSIISSQDDDVTDDALHLVSYT